MAKIITGSAVRILSEEEGLRLDLKDENDELCLTGKGREFQVLGAE